MPRSGLECTQKNFDSMLLYEQEWAGSFCLILPVLKTVSTLLLLGKRKDWF
jgi:hypothetical protein